MSLLDQLKNANSMLDNVISEARSFEDQWEMWREQYIRKIELAIQEKCVTHESVKVQIAKQEMDRNHKALQEQLDMIRKEKEQVEAQYLDVKSHFDAFRQVTQKYQGKTLELIESIQTTSDKKKKQLQNLKTRLSDLSNVYMNLNNVLNQTQDQMVIDKQFLQMTIAKSNLANVDKQKLMKILNDNQN